MCWCSPHVRVSKPPSPLRAAPAGRVVLLLLLSDACCAVSCGLPLRLLCPSCCPGPLSHAAARACCCWGPLVIYFCSHTRPVMTAHLFFLPVLNLVFIPPPSNSSVCVLAACAAQGRVKTPVSCVQYVCRWAAHNDIETRRNACCFLLVQVLILALLEGV